MDQHLRYVKAMQDQASSLAKGVHALQHQLEQLHFTDEDADQELSPIQQDVQKVSQDLSRLIAEQRQKNAEAENLEKQALQARQHAETAANRIQQCQESLHAAERLLTEKQRELAHKRQEAQFKAAELEFHQKQLQHVSEEQRQAEEQIHVSLEGQDNLTRAGGSSSLHSPSRGVEVHSPSRGIGAGMLSKVSNSMDRAKMMGSRVVPTFHKDRKAQVAPASVPTASESNQCLQHMTEAEHSLCSTWQKTTPVEYQSIRSADALFPALIGNLRAMQAIAGGQQEMLTGHIDMFRRQSMLQTALSQLQVLYGSSSAAAGVVFPAHK